MKTDDQLLERLATDLRLAGKAARTVESYLYAAKRLRCVCGKPLALVDEDDVRAYLVGLVDQGVARGTFSINPISLGIDPTDYKRLPSSILQEKPASPKANPLWRTTPPTLQKTARQRMLL